MATAKTSAESMIGLTLYGCALTGYLAIIAGVILLFMGQGQGTGVCFVAAALSFGFSANALLRD